VLISLTNSAHIDRGEISLEIGSMKCPNRGDAATANQLLCLKLSAINKQSLLFGSQRKGEEKSRHHHFIRSSPIFVLSLFGISFGMKPSNH